MEFQLICCLQFSVIWLECLNEAESAKKEVNDGYRFELIPWILRKYMTNNHRNVNKCSPNRVRNGEKLNIKVIRWFSFALPQMFGTQIRWIWDSDRKSISVSILNAYLELEFQWKTYHTNYSYLFRVKKEPGTSSPNLVQPEGELRAKR